MKHLYLFFFLFSIALTAQTTATFENFDLADESFLNGIDGSTSFSSGNVNLPVDYNTNFMSWSGWSISNTTDTVTSGFMNQYSAITGGGYDGSDNYAVGFFFGNTNLRLRNDALGDPITGFYVTNSTYAHNSMRDGDTAAKRFGGETGDDPDFFLLTIKGVLAGTETTDSVNFYLADYRFADNEQDYIVDEWTFVDLTPLGSVDSLMFNLSSTDNHVMFGMNTPAYVCIDNVITTDATVSTREPLLTTGVTLYPNPVKDRLQLVVEAGINLQAYQIIDELGRVIAQGRPDALIDVSQLKRGIYSLRLSTSEGIAVQRFVKQ